MKLAAATRKSNFLVLMISAWAFEENAFVESSTRTQIGKSPVRKAFSLRTLNLLFFLASMNNNKKKKQ